jgi:aminoglycoside phosphotransferase (APT) family kinase protein
MNNFITIHIDVFLVHQLINSQFPQWSHFSVTPVKHGGWDNRTFHLGEHMSVRLPSAAQYADKVKKEQYWLPKLAPYLPLQIPTPLAIGNPTKEYPFHWSIYKWIDGETASHENILDLNQFATELACFLVVLQRINSSGGPIAGTHNFYRGGLLKIYDAEVQQAITKLGDKIDFESVKQIWSDALASTWNKSSVWVHGDVAPTNLIVKNGKLMAVIDFGGLGVGDPACDYAIGWTFFDRESRIVFRNVLAVNDQTWNRARGWALWKALITYAELSGTNAAEKEKSKKVIDMLIADYKNEL